jgi:hypothetical protein
MRPPGRANIALVLVVIYTVIIVAPLSLHLPAIGRAVTMECSGDCGKCGCSPAQSANRTCCCWQKKQQAGHGHEGQTAACCKKNKDHHDKPVLSCGSPCRDVKVMLPGTEDNSEQIPYMFRATAVAVHGEALSATYRSTLTDLHLSPPDPPPKITHLC